MSPIMAVKATVPPRAHPRRLDRNRLMRDSNAAVTAHIEWMRQRGLSPTYITARRRILTHLHGHLSKPLLRASAQDLSRWRAQLTVSPATVVHAVSHVREFYGWAAAAKLIPSSPAVGIPVPKIGRGIPRPVSEMRIAAALAGAPPRIKPWLELAGWCGSRAQEIARLRVEDIRLDAAHLIVSAYAGKGGRMRVVPLADFILAEIPSWNLPARGWAFPRFDGKSGPNAPWVVSQLANAYLHEQGIPDTLHAWRHRFATMALHGGANLRTVQELLGHANPATTAIYTAYIQAEGRVAVNTIPLPRLPDEVRPPWCHHCGERLADCGHG